MCSIIGVEERLHKVLGQIDFGMLDSGERSLPFGLLVFCFQLFSLLASLAPYIMNLIAITFYGMHNQYNLIVL